MSFPHRSARHVPADASLDVHSPGYWAAGANGHESPGGASGRSSLAYAYRSCETTTWTIRHDQTADYVFRSRTTRQASWSSVEPGMETRGYLRIEQEMEIRGSVPMEQVIGTLGSLRLEQPEAPRNHDHRKITDSHRIVPGSPNRHLETHGSLRRDQPEAPRDHDDRKIRDPYRTVPGPTNREPRSPEYSGQGSSDRKYRQGGYNSKPSRSQGQRSHSYSSGEESDHKSSEHRCDKNSTQNKFEAGRNTSRCQYSNDRSRKNEYKPDTSTRSSRRDGDYGRSNKHESSRTSNQNHYNRDSGRSRKHEPDYKAGSHHRNQDNSRSNKYKTEPRYEKPRPKICSTIEEEEEDLPNYYAMLGISSFASPEDIRRAAKSKRVEVHPDKCVKPDMSETEKAKSYEIAAAVGQAADVLTNAEQKWWYDKKFAHKWQL